jgi:hypothetical protein
VVPDATGPAQKRGTSTEPEELERPEVEPEAPVARITGRGEDEGRAGVKKESAPPKYSRQGTLTPSSR